MSFHQEELSGDREHEERLKRRCAQWRQKLLWAKTLLDCADAAACYGPARDAALAERNLEQAAEAITELQEELLR